ncbi:hypothetical protein ACP70R_030082 [Stipagrostis hirtigluma subsp. patula]
MVEVLLSESGNALSKEQVLSTEKSILSKLQWNLTVPTVYMFVARYLKAAMGDKKLDNLTFFYAELALVEYLLLSYSPSVMAAAAVDCAKRLLSLHSTASDGSLNEVLCPEHGIVSVHAPAKIEASGRC